MPIHTYVQLSTVKSIFNKQYDIINSIKDLYPFDKIDELIKLIINSSVSSSDEHIEQTGKILYIIGIGKSENLAKHLVSLLNSISIRSVSISAQNGLHGDICIIRDNDMVMYFSNSGNTPELLNIAQYLSKRSSISIGVFANKNGKLLKYCTHNVILPNCKEVDRFSIVPTSSVLCYMFFINTLVAGIMEYKDMKIEEYARNHPDGSIGKRVYIKAGDIMIKRKNIVVVDEDTILKDCLFMMCEKRLRCAVVVKKETLNTTDIIIGIITDGDVRRYLAERGSDKLISKHTVNECKISNPFIIHEYDSLYNVIKDIKEDYRLLSGIPVVDTNNKLSGLISQEQIVEYGL